MGLEFVEFFFEASLAMAMAKDEIDELPKDARRFVRSISTQVVCVAGNRPILLRIYYAPAKLVETYRNRVEVARYAMAQDSFSRDIYDKDYRTQQRHACKGYEHEGELFNQAG